MTFEWPSWVNPLPFPFPELHKIQIFIFELHLNSTNKCTVHREFTFSIWCKEDLTRFLEIVNFTLCLCKETEKLEFQMCAYARIPACEGSIDYWFIIGAAWCEDLQPSWRRPISSFLPIVSKSMTEISREQSRICSHGTSNSNVCNVNF